MGDPTEPAKGEEPHNIHSDEEGQPESDNEDAEAEVIQPAAVARATDVSQHLQDQNPGTCRAIPDVSSNADTVQSILSSIANPNAAIVIPLDANTGGGDGEIDAARMERFYTGALSAITKMRKQTTKAETKIETLRDEVGHSTMQAWTDEHFDSLRHASGDK